jgi:hypothetical protein
MPVNKLPPKTSTTGSMGIVSSVTIVDGGYDVEVDMGGGVIVTAEHSGSAACEDPPIKGDEAYLLRGEGSGSWTIVGFGRTDTPSAGPGEFRVTARDPDSKAVVAEFYMRRDGTIVINGVSIDPDGNISTPGNMKAEGEVTASAGSAGAIDLSTHIHGHPMGPTQGPTQPPAP